MFGVGGPFAVDAGDVSGGVFSVLAGALVEVVVEGGGGVGEVLQPRAALGCVAAVFVELGGDGRDVGCSFRDASFERSGAMLLRAEVTSGVGDLFGVAVAVQRPVVSGEDVSRVDAAGLQFGEFDDELSVLFGRGCEPRREVAQLHVVPADLVFEVVAVRSVPV